MCPYPPVPPSGCPQRMNPPSGFNNASSAVPPAIESPNGPSTAPALLVHPDMLKKSKGLSRGPSPWGLASPAAWPAWRSPATGLHPPSALDPHHRAGVGRGPGHVEKQALVLTSCKRHIHALQKVTEVWKCVMWKVKAPHTER